MSERLTVTFDTTEWPSRHGESNDEYAERVLKEMGHDVEVLYTVDTAPAFESLHPGKPMTRHSGPFTMTVEFLGSVSG